MSGLIKIGNVVFNRRNIKEIGKRRVERAFLWNKKPPIWVIEVWDGTYNWYEGKYFRATVRVAEFDTDKDADRFLREIMELDAALDFDPSAELYEGRPKVN